MILAHHVQSVKVNEKTNIDVCVVKLDIAESGLFAYIYIYLSGINPEYCVMLFLQGQNSHSVSVITTDLDYLTWEEAFTCLSDDRLPDQLRAKYCDLIISKCTLAC